MDSVTTKETVIQERETDVNAIGGALMEALYVRKGYVTRNPFSISTGIDRRGVRSVAGPRSAISQCGGFTATRCLVKRELTDQLAPGGTSNGADRSRDEAERA